MHVKTLSITLQFRCFYESFQILRIVCQELQAQIDELQNMISRLIFSTRILGSSRLEMKLLLDFGRLSALTV